MRAPDPHRRPKLASDRKDRAYPPTERRPAPSRLIELFPGKGKEKNAQEAEPAPVSDRSLPARPADMQVDSGIGHLSYIHPITTGGGKPRPFVSPVISFSSSSAGASPIMMIRNHHPCGNNRSAHPITNASKSTNMPASGAPRLYSRGRDLTSAEPAEAARPRRGFRLRWASADRHSHATAVGGHPLRIPPRLEPTSPK